MYDLSLTFHFNITFVYVQLNDQTVLFQRIQSAIWKTETPHNQTTHNQTAQNKHSHKNKR